jgi:plasmid stability protein
MAGGRHRFARTELLLEPSLKAHLEARARAEGCSVGELARDLLSVALEAREAGPGTVVKSRADRLVELAEENLNELRMPTRTSASAKKNSPPSSTRSGPRAGSRSWLSCARRPRSRLRDASARSEPVNATYERRQDEEDGAPRRSPRPGLPEGCRREI